MPRTGGIASIGGSNCNSRLTQVTYPSGRKLDYVYDSGLDATISRVTAIADDVSGTPSTRLEAYLYLGVDTIVQRTHAQSGVNLTYIKQGTDPKAIADAGDPYTGLDRFGRVIDQNWFKTSTSTSTDRSQYGYDRAGQRLYKANLVDSALSELYHANSATSGDDNTAYDPLGRLTAFRRGTLSASANNGGKLDTIATTSKSQSWSLDALGNWSGQTTDSTTTTRSFNAQNQTTAASGGGATTPTYNAAGNSITSNGLTFVYDAWNRLTSVKSGSTVVASYRYDALSRRITETTGSTTDQLYYSADWQVLEERRGGTGSSFLSQQYVWGLGYVDDLVLRDSYTSGALSQRLYVQQDAQFNVTALTGTSGAVVERYLYDPYGATTITDASYAARAGNASLYAWKYLHQGGRLDATTSWYSFRNRDYIASEGRWAERDPLGLAAGDMNVYRYVGNGPTYAADPSGLEVPGENHNYPLHLGGHPKKQPLYMLNSEDHTKFHKYFREKGFGPGSRDADRTKWKALTQLQRKDHLINAMKEANIPDAWIEKNIGKIMKGARPGFNFSPYRKASTATLSKLAILKVGLVVGVVVDILANPSTVYAAEVNTDWRDSVMQRLLGNSEENTEVAMFRRVVMVPSMINVFGSVEASDRTLVMPWQDQGLMTAQDAMLLEGKIDKKPLYSNAMYTVYEETYYQARWGGKESGIPRSASIK